jgi:hypothetical protein
VSGRADRFSDNEFLAAGFSESKGSDMATISTKPKLEERIASAKIGAHADIPREAKEQAEKTVMFIGGTADEWKEAAADRLVKGADWLAGATGRLSSRLATVAADEKVRENALKAVGVVTGAGALLAGQAARIKPVAAYRATASYARNHPKTAVAGGLVTAAALYGAYRAYRNVQPESASRKDKPAYDY